MFPISDDYVEGIVKLGAIAVYFVVNASSIGIEKFAAKG